MPQSKKAAEGRAANREKRRQQLIDATIDSISRVGFSGTTLERVTKGAKLSHGVVNFYFDSKEELYVQTLGYLAREHYEGWYGSMLQAGPKPADQLLAIIAADFDRTIASPKKLAVWYAFWGQAKYRPNYLKTHSSFDEERYAEILRLCAEITAEGDYPHGDVESIARGVEALVDGLWLSLLLYPKWSDRDRARGDVLTFLALAFPKHFEAPARPQQTLEETSGS
ncbi:MAG: TetR family transcriptional regulator C-terminal domain-containing protein [Pseudomonadota bacterium]